MKEKILKTVSGAIHYWTNDILPNRKTLVFLPGLTASRPFLLDFSLMDKAVWLHAILEKEGIAHPVLIGQSMGGYVSQCFIQKYPGEAAGFISIDSAPLKRKYVTGAEIWLLKRTEPMYRAFPWGSLKKIGSDGCATSEYGRKLMRSFLESYTKDEYCKLAGHGMKLLAEAMEADLSYVIDCPMILLCGEKDQAGSAKSYNRRWAKRERIPIRWIRGAGHNSNTDKPEEVNQIIRGFVRSIQEKRLPCTSEYAALKKHSSKRK